MRLNQGILARQRGVACNASSRMIHRSFVECTSAHILNTAHCPRFTPPQRAFYRQSRRANSSRAPSVSPKWFYAVDVPLSKLDAVDNKQQEEPAKFVAFSSSDQRRLEAAYQTLQADKLSLSLLDVNEDRLYKVCLKKQVIQPVYWDGATYEVRRSVWFTSDGVPLPNAISKNLEKGYFEKKPFAFAASNKNSVESAKSGVYKFNNNGNTNTQSKKDGIASSNETEDHIIAADGEPDLFAVSENKLVLYFDDTHAVLIPKSYATSFHLNVIRNFGPSRVLLMSVERIRRGFPKTQDDLVLSKIPSNTVSNRFKDKSKDQVSVATETDATTTPASSEKHMDLDQSTISSSSTAAHSLKDSPRKVDHLVLCVHGIGQILGSRLETAKFAHSVNCLRTNMKLEFESSKSLRKLAYREDFDLPEAKANNRVQILPVSWRHKIDFHPEKSALRDDAGKSRLPSLTQLNLEGVMPIRNIMGDVILDILLFYEPKYAELLLEAVALEINRVYSLFLDRNPYFQGQVHILGHSLGSAIVFDILSKQPPPFAETKSASKTLLRFPVENLFCLGLPVGMFKLLQQRNIYSRQAVGDQENFLEENCTFASPKCQNLYNIFHPCDPIAYRMEPLVRTRFHKIRPELIPAAARSIFNNQILDIGEGISEKISQASNWFNVSKKPASRGTLDEEVEEDKAIKNLPLNDLLSNITYSNELLSFKGPTYEKEVKGSELQPLLDLNRTGRVDYSLKPGVFQLSLVSALSAHVSYFEDDDTASFLLKQILTSQQGDVKVKTIQVSPQ